MEIAYENDKLRENPASVRESNESLPHRNMRRADTTYSSMPDSQMFETNDTQIRTSLKRRFIFLACLICSWPAMECILNGVFSFNYFAFQHLLGK